MSIPQDFIDNLISRVDIVEVIDARVPLKKAGRDYSACCPFHNEKTPSFTVSPTKQFYYCFGCGANGTALKFLMEFERLSFPEAVKELAGGLGMSVPNNGTPSAPPVDQGLLDLMEKAAAWYREQLSSHPQARMCQDYLRQRGLDRNTVDAFQIGFAPPGWDNLGKALGRSPGSSTGLAERLVISGLMIEKDDGKRYDRFRERLMFPIRDRRGRVIGFGGRAFGDAKPKYLNSPESPVFHKGQELYGLHELIERREKPGQIVVVEGYMDVIALAQFGIGYAVAALGTSISAEHLRRLFRITPNLVFCFDGDRAGREAAWRGLKVALPFMEEGRQLRFLLLPEGEDPDTLVRKGGSKAFDQRLAAAQPLSEYLFSELRQQTDLSSPEGRARLAELAGPLITRLPDGVYRHLVLERLGSLVDMAPRDLEGYLHHQPEQTPRSMAQMAGYGHQPDSPAYSPWSQTGRSQPRQRPRSNSRNAGTLSLEQRAILMLLSAPSLAIGVDDDTVSHLRYGRGPLAAILVEMLEMARERPRITAAVYHQHWSGSEDGERLAVLAQLNPLLSDELRDEEFRAALVGLQQEVVNARINELEHLGGGNMNPSERELLRDLYQHRQRLEQQRRRTVT